jgi:hypothetical protein
MKDHLQYYKSLKKEVTLDLKDLNLRLLKFIIYNLQKPFRHF